MLIAFVMLMLITVFAIRRPAILVGAGISVFSFEQWAQVQSAFFVSHSALLNYYVGILTVFALVIVMLRGQNPLNPFPVGQRLLIGFYFFIFISCLWSINFQQSLTIVKTFVPYVGAFVFLTPLLITTEKDIRTAMLSILVVGAVVMVLLILGTRVHGYGRTIVIEHDTKVVDRRGHRTDRLSPLAVAEMSANVAIVCLLARLSGVPKVLGTVIRFGILSVAMFLIIRSGSRGQLFAVIAASGLFFGASRTKSKGGQVFLGALVLTLFIAGAVYLFSAMEVVGAKRWEVDKMTTDFSDTRLYMCTKLINYWLGSSPITLLFGLGTSASFDDRLLGYYCHVIPVEVLCELGLFGMMWYLTIIFFIVKSWFNLMKIYRDDPINRGYAAAIGALIGFTFLISLKQGTFLGNMFFAMHAMLLFRFESIAIKAMKQLEARKSQWMWLQQLRHAKQVRDAGMVANPAAPAT